MEIPFTLADVALRILLTSAIEDKIMIWASSKEEAEAIHKFLCISCGDRLLIRKTMKPYCEILLNNRIRIRTFYNKLDLCGQDADYIFITEKVDIEFRQNIENTYHFLDSTILTLRI